MLSYSEWKTPDSSLLGRIIPCVVDPSVVKFIRIDMSGAFALKKFADFPTHIKLNTKDRNPPIKSLLILHFSDFPSKTACFLTGSQIPVTAEILDCFLFFHSRRAMVILKVWCVCQIICIASMGLSQAGINSLSCKQYYFENKLWDLTTSRSLFRFFLYFSCKFVHSSFEIHSVLVTGTVATCCVYLKNDSRHNVRRWIIFEVLIIFRTLGKSFTMNRWTITYFVALQ